MKFIPPGFWSLTMYSSETWYTVPNPINRYCLGSDNQLKTNADGSFTIYVQKDSPARTRSPTGCRRLRDRSTSTFELTRRRLLSSSL